MSAPVNVSAQLDELAACAGPVGKLAVSVSAPGDVPPRREVARLIRAWCDSRRWRVTRIVFGDLGPVAYMERVK